jgi:hypothetical protein
MLIAYKLGGAVRLKMFIMWKMLEVLSVQIKISSITTKRVYRFLTEK